jgi:hypothetical protein
MPDQEFDQALIAGAFALAARDGWHAVSPAAAAREAGLPLEHVRPRFPATIAILARFGALADEQALTGALQEGPVRERLFDTIMRRFDALQAHRAGVLALLAALPAHPATALALAALTTRSMGWLLEAAGVASTGLRGGLATQGLTAVWFYTLRAWRSDDTADLSGTMAALDRALSNAERVAGWLQQTAPASEPEPGPKPFPEPPAADATALAGAISGAADTPPPPDPGI